MSVVLQLNNNPAPFLGFSHSFPLGEYFQWVLQWDEQPETDSSSLCDHTPRMTSMEFINH